MTRTLYLDCFAGASGDMLVGAMLDCGLDFELLRSELLKLGVEGYELSLTRVDRSGISAAKFDVHLTQMWAGETHLREREHSHEHHHEREHSHEHHHHEHRGLSEIKSIIASSTLSEQVKHRAHAIFQRSGEAESKTHNIRTETVHFHEVGAIDSIVDIVGSCVAFDALKTARIIPAPLHVGSGTFKCAHGPYPVPGPATAELLK